jgi:hypothetical protein
MKGPAEEYREVHVDSGVGEMNSAIHEAAIAARQPVPVDLALRKLVENPRTDP